MNAYYDKNMRNMFLKRNLLALGLLTAFIAVFCNCIFIVPNHACCKSQQVSSIEKNNETPTCCQIKTAVVTPSPNFPDIPNFDKWVSSSRNSLNYYELAVVNPEFQPIESQIFIKDQSKRRRIELSVFLN